MGFEKCHPVVNFIYFTTVIAGMIVFQHPIFLLISFAYISFITVRNGKKSSETSFFVSIISFTAINRTPFIGKYSSTYYPVFM